MTFDSMVKVKMNTVVYMACNANIVYACNGFIF